MSYRSKFEVSECEADYIAATYRPDTSSAHEKLRIHGMINESEDGSIPVHMIMVFNGEEYPIKAVLFESNGFFYVEDVAMAHNTYYRAYANGTMARDIKYITGWKLPQSQSLDPEQE